MTNGTSDRHPDGASALAALALLLGISTLPAAAMASTAAEAMCEEVARQLDAIASHQGTLCIPGATAGRKQGWWSFTVVAPRPVMSAPKARSAYAVLVCAAFGHALNASRTVRADEVWISDTSGARVGEAYSLRLDLCQHLQPRVHDGRMSLEAMRERVNEALRPQKVPLTTTQP